MWSKFQCRCCGAIVTNAKERRTLDNALNSQAAALFVHCLSQYYNKLESEVRPLLSPVDPSVKGLDHSYMYMCNRPCFAALKKRKWHYRQTLPTLLT